MIGLKLTTGHKVGEIIGDTAIIPVTSRNYLGVAKGYSLASEVLRTIENAGCLFIEFHNVKSGKRFRISVEDFLANKKGPFNWGFGEKWAAPDSFYKIEPNSSSSNLYA